MTMLEKLARAICRAYWQSYAERRYTTGARDPDAMAEDDWQDWLPEARAVLTALRACQDNDDEADEAFHAEIKKQREYSIAKYGKPAYASGPFIDGIWRARIDSILNEKAASL